MKDLGFKIFYALTWAFSHLPMRVLLLISDCTYPFVRYVFRYRRSVVRRNLVTSFPEKTQAEIIELEKKFYRYFCDFIFETIKFLTIDREKFLRDHMIYIDADQLDDVFDRGQDVGALLGHYGNWEWLCSTQLSYPRRRDAGCALIYHPLHSRLFDRMMIAIRSAKNGFCVPKQNTLREAINCRNRNFRALFGYVADQSPKWENCHLWLPFLNHETAVFTGGARIMRKVDNAVFYMQMKRLGRAKYTCTFHLIAPHAAEVSEEEIISKFFQLLEADVLADPAFYLWTHDRWKRTKEEFDRRINVVGGRVIPKENAQ